MSVCFLRGAGAAILATSIATGAWADLTAQEVWADWRAYMTSVGYEVSANESMSGNVLTVSDAIANMAMDQESGSATIELGTLTFTEAGDGTVSVSMPQMIPIRFSGKDENGDVSGVVTLTQSGLTMIASGSPEDMQIDYAAAGLDVALGSVVIAGQPATDDMLRFSMTFGNLVSNVRMQVAEQIRMVTQKSSVDTLVYDLAFDAPDTEDKGRMNGTLSGIGMESMTTLPETTETANIQEMLANGFGFDGRFTFKGGNSNIQTLAEGKNFALESSSAGGSYAFGMDSGSQSIDFSIVDSTINVQSDELPFPVMLQMAKAGFKGEMPLAKSDEPQDFVAGMTLEDFTMSDMIWGMFDPAQVMPRDPATVVLDLSGKAKMLFDLLDPNVAAKLEDPNTVPAELHALTIRKLLVAMVGAQVSGTGDFTFDNSDLVTYEGIPAPTGALELQVSGANGLIDRLIQMGVVSQDDAMGARMMMSMLAVPGDAPDTLNSKIEFKDGGQILANGQRIK